MKRPKPHSPGFRLRALRTKGKMDQAELAAALDCSRVHVTKVELGDDDGSLQFWEAAARELKVSLDYLRFGREHPVNIGQIDFPGLGQIIEDPGARELLRIWQAVPPAMRDLAMRTLRNFAEVTPNPDKRTRLTQQLPPQ